MHTRACPHEFVVTRVAVGQPAEGFSRFLLDGVCRLAWESFSGCMGHPGSSLPLAPTCQKFLPPVSAQPCDIRGTNFALVYRLLLPSPLAGGLGLRFRSDGVQAHAVHLLPVRVQHQLPPLVGLIAIETPFRGPSS